MTEQEGRTLSVTAKPELTETDHQVATCLRAGMPTGEIAEKIGATWPEVLGSIDNLVNSGVAHHDGDRWVVQNVVGGYRQDRDDTGLTARYRHVRDGIRAKKTQKQIADELGVTKQRVAQIVKDLRKKGVLRG